MTTPPRSKKPAAKKPALPPVKRSRKPRAGSPMTAQAVAVDAAEGATAISEAEATSATPASVVASQRRKRRREAAATPDPQVVAQIRELEAQLDRLIDEASRRDVSAYAGDDEDEDEDEEGEEEEREQAADDGAAEGADAVSPGNEAPFDGEATPWASRPLPSGPLPQATTPAEQTVFDTARELLSTDFYLRKWGRVAMRGRSEEVDDFGFDPTYDAKWRPLFDFLYTRYFRVETEGVERVPDAGRCVLVANHSGTLPLDGVMIKTAVKREHPAARDVRWLTEDFIYHFPYLGSAMNRLGAVRACQENAERLLAKEQLVCVFPEGVKGIGKLFAERYRLQRFGRGGFIKLCLRTSTPIVPVAVVGAEETNPMLLRFEYLSKAVGVPYVPVTPTFPLFGAAGLVPAPTKWRILFGEPLDFSAHGPEAADDELLVGKLAERVRATIQGMLDRAVGARKSVFFG
jgi:1-acyl-sn-glycerol-3-phosphate acyltransferase